MVLGMEVGLGPGHIVLDGNPAPLPKKGVEPHNFRPISIVAKRLYFGYVTQDTTWYGGRSQPRRRCVRWEPSSPSPKGAQPPIFGQCPLWPKPVDAASNL